jgi:hypothetical protein
MEKQQKRPRKSPQSLEQRKAQRQKPQKRDKQQVFPKTESAGAEGDRTLCFRAFFVS